jgi:hypothetical protein
VGGPAWQGSRRDARPSCGHGARGACGTGTCSARGAAHLLVCTRWLAGHCARRGCWAASPTGPPDWSARPLRPRWGSAAGRGGACGVAAQSGRVRAARRLLPLRLRANPRRPLPAARRPARARPRADVRARGSRPDGAQVAARFDRPVSPIQNHSDPPLFPQPCSDRCCCGRPPRPPRCRPRPRTAGRAAAAPWTGAGAA